MSAREAHRPRRTIARLSAAMASKLPARSVMTTTTTTTTGATAPASLKRATPARLQTAHYPSAGPCAGTGMFVCNVRSVLLFVFALFRWRFFGLLSCFCIQRFVACMDLLRWKTVSIMSFRYCLNGALAQILETPVVRERVFACG